MASLLFPFFEVSRGIHFRFAEISRKKKKREISWKKGGSKYTRYRKTMTSRSRSVKRSSFTLITRLLSPEMFLKPLFEVISLEKKISTLNVPRKLALVHFNFTASQSKSIDIGVGLNNDKNDVQSCLKNCT